MPIAITREVSPALARGELSFLPRTDIDLLLAETQHRNYEAALEACGYHVRALPAEPAMPDSVFVEDAAIVLDELAIITRPGAQSRRPETPSIADVLGEYRRLVHIEAPGTLDGGDVLRIGRVLYVGNSARSNAEGAGQLAQLIEPYEYEVRVVPFRNCLHLKTAVTQIAPDRLLINPEWVDAQHFAGMDGLHVDPSEPHGANAVYLDGAVLYPASAPRTREKLEANGVSIIAVDMSETEKLEGGVTCCSLLLDHCD